jgi:hypothetical protein
MGLLKKAINASENSQISLIIFNKISELVAKNTP